MAQMLSKRIAAFLGENEGQNPLTLADVYSSDSSFGTYLDKLGQIKPVGGYTQLGTAITVSGGEIPCIRDLYMYRRTESNGTITRQLIIVADDEVNEYEISYSTNLNTSRTLIVDLGSGSCGKVSTFAQLGNDLIFTNGAVAPRMWDGTTWSTAGFSQLSAPTAASGGAGVLRGNYKWKLVPIKAAKVRKPASAPSTVFQANDNDVDLSWSADADGTVLGYELYRTSGTGLDYYFVQYIDGRTTVAYTDNLPDSVLITRAALSLVASHGDAPPTAYFCEPHKGRMWYACSDAFWTGVWWSDPGDPDSVYQDRSFTQLVDADSVGDYVTGMTGEFEGMLVCWLQNSVWTISGDGQLSGGVINFRKRRTNCQVGAPTAKAVVKVPMGAVYTDSQGDRHTVTKPMLAYFSSIGDIRLFDGNSDIIISTPKATALSAFNTIYSHRAVAIDDKLHGMILFAVPTAQVYPTMIIAWNYLYGTWHEWQQHEYASFCMVETDAVRNVLVGGSGTLADGRIYKLWDGKTANGSDMQAGWFTAPIYLPAVQDGPPDMEYEKRIETVILEYKKCTTPSTSTLYLFPPTAAYSELSSVVTVVRTHSTSGRVRLPAREKAAAILTENAGRYFHNTGVRLLIEDFLNTNEDAWTLRGITIQYYVLDGSTQ